MVRKWWLSGGKEIEREHRRYSGEVEQNADKETDMTKIDKERQIVV